jgi:cbb3-type cytochrome oxidase maturation protein
MDIIYLLVPLSVTLIVVIAGVLAWAFAARQFDSLEQEGERILLDADQEP